MNQVSYELVPVEVIQVKICEFAAADRVGEDVIDGHHTATAARLYRRRV
jgi:hypothetical protein